MSNLDKARAAKAAKAKQRLDDAAWNYVGRRIGQHPCGCNLRKGMTLEELRKVQSCTDYWICPNLDTYRRVLEQPDRLYS